MTVTVTQIDWIKSYDRNSHTKEEDILGFGAFGRRASFARALFLGFLGLNHLGNLASWTATGLGRGDLGKGGVGW